MIICICLTIAISANADTYYYGLGQQPLTMTDSIISIKFNPDVASNYCETFAYEIEALDESIPNEGYYNGFDIYHVKSGYSIETLLEELNNRADILFAFPAFKDSVEYTLTLNDQFVACFKSGIEQQAIDSMQMQYQVELVQGPSELTGFRVYQLTAQSSENTLDIANAFHESELVEYSHPNFSIATLFDFTPNDPYSHFQYYLYNDGSNGGQAGIDINVRKAWEITRGSDDITIAIIDDGCEYVHEDIEHELVLYNDGWDFVGDSWKYSEPDCWAMPGPERAHGTACQGIIFAKCDNDTGIAGIASNCYLLPLKFRDDNGYGGSSVEAHDAIEYAVNHWVDIISCSWGWYPNYYWPEIDSIISVAVSRGITCVFSSGNYGEDYPIGQSIGFPANLPNTIAVGAIARDGDYWLYSGSGPALDVVAPSGHNSFIHGDLYTIDGMGNYGFNPNLWTCDSVNENYMCFFGGTSGAAPQVAGILALVRSRRPDITNFHTLKKIIDSSAVDGIGDQYDTPGWDDAYGYGLADAWRALLAVCRGDANNDGTVDPLDIWHLIDFIYTYGYQQGEPVPDLLMGDANCDADVNLLDILYLIEHLYRDGEAPPICFDYGD